MRRGRTPPPGDRERKIATLIDALHDSVQRLERLTDGEVDSVTDRQGRTFLLRRAQEQLRHSEAAKKAAILNALPAHIALLNSQGVIISVNDSWGKFAGDNALNDSRQGVGMNYIDICRNSTGFDSAEAVEVSEGIRNVLIGKEKSFSIEYPCHSPTQQQWFMLSVTPHAGRSANGCDRQSARFRFR